MQGNSKGCLPAHVQAEFDVARSLARGRRGRCLENRIDPSPHAAVAAYAAALATLDSDIPNPNDAVRRCRAVYVKEQAECEQKAASLGAPRPGIDPALRESRIFAYEDKFGLLSSTCGILEIPHGACLSELHKKPVEGEPPLCPALLASFARCRKVPLTWGLLAGRRKTHIKQFRRAPEYGRWTDAYLHFVREVIKPLVPDPQGIVVQCPPTLRCQLADAKLPTGRRHRDDEYEGHQGEEINFWLPLTRVWGNNSLHVESTPGAGDFHPLNLDFGQFYRFHGGQCEHYTKANDTGSTRVSLDFRVIPRSLWLDMFGQRIGEYPCVLLP